MAYDPSDWDTADDTAKVTAQHFFTDNDGAHVTETEEDPDTGANLLLTSGGVDVRDGTTPLAWLHNDGAQIGRSGTSHVAVTDTAIGMWTGDDSYDNPQVKVLNIYYNGNYAHVDAPASGLWLGSTNNNVTLAAADNDANGAIRLRSGKVQVADETGTQVWSGTAQQMADALNYKANAPRIYNGNFVKNVGSSNVQRTQIWTDATFCSTFNVSSGHVGDCAVCFSNTNYNAGNLGAVGSEYVPSGGWYAHWTANATGNKQFGYLVVVPAAYSTV